MPAWQKDISSRCTYAAGTGLAEDSVLAVFILTQQETVKNSLYYTNLLKQVKEDLQNHLRYLFKTCMCMPCFSVFKQVKKYWRT